MNVISFLYITFFFLNKCFPKLEVKNISKLLAIQSLIQQNNITTNKKREELMHLLLFVKFFSCDWPQNSYWQ
jgi:hypothetical protein